MKNPSSTPGTSSNRAAPVDVEIVSEEEMAFIEAALSSAHSLVRARAFPASSFSGEPPPRPCTALSADIEDVGRCRSSRRKPWFPKGSLLTVTDLVRAEWCEKQMELSLMHGKPKPTTAMKAGSRRHAELEAEVIQRIEISIKSKEDSWAVKFLNFIVGVNQLLFDGLTRELPVVGFLEDMWVIGIIDELRLDLAASNTNPLLVDTKIRTKATLPSEAQKRNARLQLMCYKYLWDNNISGSCMDQFMECFNLNPECLLSGSVIEYGASLGLQLKTLQDVFVHFREVTVALSPSNDRMILRYEFQEDNSLLGECAFEFDNYWFKTQVQRCVDFLQCVREANYVASDELFKCNYCAFARKES